METSMSPLVGKVGKYVSTSVENFFTVTSMSLN